MTMENNNGSGNNIQPDLDDHYLRQQLVQSISEIDREHLPPHLRFPQPSQPTGLHHYQHILPADADSDILTAATAAANAAAARASRNDSPNDTLLNNRLKISRACDECRRKKIRCDADTDNDASSCSQCRKFNQICQFSRIPSKRGPSKGYIKDLADRVSHLEKEQHSFEHPPSHGPQAKGSGIDLEDSAFLASSDTVGGMRFKRTISQSLGRNDHYTASGRTGFPPAQLSVPLHMTSFNRYDHQIHMTLPLLPRVPEYVRTALLPCSESTKAAFLATFQGTMNASFYSFSSEISDDAANKAYQLYLQSHWSDSPNLFQLQALLFLAIDASNRGTLVINGDHGSSPWEFLEEAAAKCKSIPKLDFAFDPKQMSGELDMQFRISRGVLLSMLILDAFFAFADRKHGPALEYNYILVSDKDLDVAGQRTYRLARLASTLHRLANVRIEDSDMDYSPHAPARSTVNPSKNIKLTPGDTNIMARFKEEDIKDLKLYLPPDDLILQLAFWYTRLQIEIHYYPIAVIRNIMYPCKKMVNCFVKLAQHRRTANTCPLTFHFSGLVAHVLVQLCEFIDTKNESMELLAQLDVALHDVVPSTDTCSFDAGIRDTVSRRRAVLASVRLGVESLATAGTSGAPAEERLTMDDALQAAAEAAAKAAHAQIMANTRVFTGNKLSQDGYLVALLLNQR